jgi:hypothetical protein
MASGIGFGLHGHSSKRADKKKSRVLSHAGLFPGRYPGKLLRPAAPAGPKPGKGAALPKKLFLLLLGGFLLGSLLLCSFLLSGHDESPRLPLYFPSNPADTATTTGRVPTHSAMVQCPIAEFFENDGWNGMPY